MLVRARRLLVQIEMPTFAKSRYERRFNMQDEDRIKIFNWNVACLTLTALPVLYMMNVKYRSSDDTDQIVRTLDPVGDAKVAPGNFFRV